MKLILCLGLALAASCARGGEVNIGNFGAIPDDDIDDTPAFAAADASGTNLTVRLPRGRFILNGHAWTNANVAIVGAGRETILTPSISTNTLFFNTPGQRVRLSNLQVDGARQPENAVYIIGATEAILENVYVHGAGTLGGTNAVDGVSFFGANGRLIINDSEFAENERDGVLAWTAKELAVMNSVARDNGRGGFCGDIFEKTGPQRISFQGNTITNCGAIGLYAESVITQPCDISIVGNAILNCGKAEALWEYSYGIAAGNYTRGVIQGNRIENFGGAVAIKGYGNAIELNSIAGAVAVIGNKIVNPRGFGIAAANGKGTGTPVICANTISGAGRSGIYVYLFPNAIVSNNEITGSGEDGIFVHTSLRAKVLGNTIRKSSAREKGKHSGVRALASYSLNVSENEIEGDDQRFGIEQDASTSIAEMNANKITTFSSGWITNGAGTTGGRIIGGRQLFQKATTSPPEKKKE
jgi:parallel beta-helix repeat protein